MNVESTKPYPTADDYPIENRRSFCRHCGALVPETEVDAHCRGHEEAAPAWMVERVENGQMVGWYAGRGVHDLTTDPNAAVRYPSKEAADFYIRSIHSAHRDGLIATEHAWIASTTRPEPAAAEPVAELIKAANEQGFVEGRQAAVDRLKKILRDAGPCLVIHLPAGADCLQWTLLSAPPSPSAPSQPSEGPARVTDAFAALVEGCVQEFGDPEDGPSGEPWPDDERVSYPEDRCHITFGMIRHASAALAAAKGKA